MLQLLLLLFLSLDPALAQTDGMTRMAEYERLGQELRSLATRNAWIGVEAAYDGMIETGIPLTAEEHHLGAQSAAYAGDVAATRQRLIHALEVMDDSEFRDWIHVIDTEYGPVSLKGDPGGVELGVANPPFNPRQVAAIAFAKQRVEATGSFEGLLPAGNYQFGPMSLRVRPGVHTERIDIRTDKYMRKLERQERKEARDGDGEESG